VKILLDACVGGGVLQALREDGHDIVWAGEWTEDPGDEEILQRAYREGRILITLDKDFGELAVVRGMPHCGIVRLVGLSAKKQAAICGETVVRYAQELRVGGIVTVEPDRVRIRPV
jgi:predicted nuclease of predicted toxin-antitoxin system